MSLTATPPGPSPGPKNDLHQRLQPTRDGVLFISGYAFFQGAGPADITMNPSVSPPLTPGVWAGVVNSHFIHFDPMLAGGVAFLNGSVTMVIREWEH